MSEGIHYLNRMWKEYESTEDALGEILAELEQYPSPGPTELHISYESSVGDMLSTERMLPTGSAWEKWGMCECFRSLLLFAFLVYVFTLCCKSHFVANTMVVPGEVVETRDCERGGCEASSCERSCT